MAADRVALDRAALHAALVTHRATLEDIKQGITKKGTDYAVERAIRAYLSALVEQLPEEAVEKATEAVAGPLGYHPANIRPIAVVAVGAFLRSLLGENGR